MAASKLTDDESKTVERLQLRALAIRSWLMIPDLYYRGLQKIQDLGISTPPSLVGLRTVVGWPMVYVDTLEERLDVEGFRFPGEPDADAETAEIWALNNMAEESQLAHLDALVFGHSYEITAARSDDPREALITVESPTNVVVDYDPTTREVTAALHLYGQYNWINFSYQEATQAVLYTDTDFVTLQRAGNGAKWEVTDRQPNPLGYVPVERVVNRQRVGDRIGRSQITPSMMSISDAACRTLLGLEVSREFYATPQRYVLGVDEENFQDGNGNPINMWETYLGKLWALPRDDNDEVPTVGEFKSYDPSVYTAIVDMYAKVFISQTGLPSEYLGVVDAQPASADAIRMKEQRLVKTSERKQSAFGGAHAGSMRTALRIRHGVDSVDEKRLASLQTLWRDAATPTLAAQADATQKWVASGILPARSSVTLDRAGFSLGEQERIKADWVSEDARTAALAQKAAAQAAAAAPSPATGLKPTFSSAE